MILEEFMCRQMGRTKWLAIPLLVAALAGGAAAQENAKKLNLGMYLDMVGVSDPQIAPDGKQILYTRRWVDKINDRYITALWIMNSDGSHQRFFAKGGDGRWSPDGTRIAYVAEAPPRGEQIFVQWLDAPSGSQITNVDQTPTGLAWSADGKQIAFLMSVPAHRDGFNIKLPGEPAGAKWTPAPRIVQRLIYQADRQGFLPDAYRHIFVVSADGGAPRQLTTGAWNDGGGFGGGGLSWTPDNTEILFSADRVEDFEYRRQESYIYAVNAANGAVRQLTAEKAAHQDPVVSPDGKYVAYSGHPLVAEAYTTSHLYVMNLDGTNARELAASLDRSPVGLMWAPDASGVYFNADTDGTRNLYFAPLAGDVRKLTEGDHMLTVSSISNTGQAAATITAFYKPLDVYTFNVASQDPRQLTFVNGDLLGGVKLGQVEEFSYNSFDNLKIEGWIIKPPDFQPGKKYPLILNIHGGPAGMYNVGFNFALQEHAANGYVVVYINPRGSTGYGSDFANGINFDYPGPDFKDLMKGVDAVLARGYVDPQNLFVYGCSGGGVLTSWTVGHTNRFAAAVVECPVIDWLSFGGETDSINYYYLFFHKLPWEDPSEFLKHSSVMYANQVKTPTLLLTGVLDRRTPMPQTEEFYEALKLLKVPTAMIQMNDEYHGAIGHPSNFMRNQLYLRYWFEKYSRK
ncbi:MAG TPA: S9 family peptidase [Candidatus Acidoferrales bacterium]|nr:S9 family peptidase [Candidatus Acidoferrales bacterium]